MIHIIDILKRLLLTIRVHQAADRQSKIAEGTYIGKGSHIVDYVIGKYCSIGPNVKIGEYDHYLYAVTTHPFINHREWCMIKNDYFPREQKKAGKSQSIIGNDVWIGADVNVLRGIKIGDGAVIGANSTVTKDIPPYAIAVGSPARVIKYRFSTEEIKILRKSHWWDWDEKELRDAVPHMYQIKDFLQFIEKKNISD